MGESNAASRLHRAAAHGPGPLGVFRGPLSARPCRRGPMGPRPKRWRLTFLGEPLPGYEIGVVPPGIQAEWLLGGDLCESGPSLRDLWPLEREFEEDVFECALQCLALCPAARPGMRDVSLSAAWREPGCHAHYCGFDQNSLRKNGHPEHTSAACAVFTRKLVEHFFQRGFAINAKTASAELAPFLRGLLAESVAERDTHRGVETEVRLDAAPAPWLSVLSDHEIFDACSLAKVLRSMGVGAMPLTALKTSVDPTARSQVGNTMAILDASRFPASQSRSDCQGRCRMRDAWKHAVAQPHWERVGRGTGAAGTHVE